MSQPRYAPAAPGDQCAGPAARPLRLLAFEHHSTSPPGLIGEQAARRGARLRIVDAERGCVVPADAPVHDGLLILGGAMGAMDDAACPHFPALIALARRFAAEGKPVLGICLGGQLLARAFGGAVHPGTAGEFGFVPVEATEAARSDPLLAGTPSPVTVMQWHDDSFTPPPGSVPLLTGAGCRWQAFRVADSAWGFQCHLEVTAADLDAWGRLRAAATGDPTTSAALAAAATRLYPAAEAFGRAVADRWLDLCGSRRAAPGPAASGGLDGEPQTGSDRG